MTPARTAKELLVPEHPNKLLKVHFKFSKKANLRFPPLTNLNQLPIPEMVNRNDLHISRNNIPIMSDQITTKRAAKKNSQEIAKTKQIHVQLFFCNKSPQWKYRNRVITSRTINFIFMCYYYHLWVCCLLQQLPKKRLNCQTIASDWNITFDPFLCP